MSYVVKGKTRHQRIKPGTHSFEYPLLMVYVDTQKLTDMSRFPVFGYNKRRLFSLFDQDFLQAGKRSVSEKIRHIT